MMGYYKLMVILFNVTPKKNAQVLNQVCPNFLSQGISLHISRDNTNHETHISSLFSVQAFTYAINPS